jgi:hypothetical protein
MSKKISPATRQAEPHLEEGIIFCLGLSHKLYFNVIPILNQVHHRLQSESLVSEKPYWAKGLEIPAFAVMTGFE